MTDYTLQAIGDSLANGSILTTSFHAFDAQHLAALSVIAVVCWIIACAARRKDWTVRKWLGRLIGLVLLSYAVCIYAQQAVEHALNWEYSLPLELCDLILIACIVSLFRPSPLPAEIAYFVGLGGVLQAALTPDLAKGFPSWDFVLFFWGHGATLSAITFLIASGEFRPRKGRILRMMIALNIYGLVVGVIDAVMGWNYGYLCRKPAMPSLLDLLGPWPWYLAAVECIAFLTFLLLDLPWRLLVLLGRRNSTVSGDD